MYEGQIITFVASATLGTSSGTATQVGMGPCYQANGSPLVHFAGTGYTTMAAINARTTVPASAVLKVIAGNAIPNTGEISAGTYYFGFGIRNISAPAINASDAINGFIMVQ